jgi:hypothetical protein
MTFLMPSSVEEGVICATMRQQPRVGGQDLIDEAPRAVRAAGMFGAGNGGGRLLVGPISSMTMSGLLGGDGVVIGEIQVAMF